MPNTGWRCRQRSHSVRALLMIGPLVAPTTLIFLPRINAAEFPQECMTGCHNPLQALERRTPGGSRRGRPFIYHRPLRSNCPRCRRRVAHRLSHCSVAGRTTWFPPNGRETFRGLDRCRPNSISVPSIRSLAGPSGTFRTHTVAAAECRALMVQALRAFLAEIRQTGYRSHHEPQQISAQAQI